MPTKQVTQECCTGQEAGDDDCKQEHTEDKDGQEHQASRIVPKYDENETADDGHDCKEGEANASRREMHEKKRQQRTAFLLWLRVHRANDKLSDRRPTGRVERGRSVRIPAEQRAEKRGACSSPASCWAMLSLSFQDEVADSRHHRRDCDEAKASSNRSILLKCHESEEGSNAREPSSGGDSMRSLFRCTLRVLNVDLSRLGCIIHSVLSRWFCAQRSASATPRR
jgi:hypothetical protein